MPLSFDDPSIVFDINTGTILEASAGSGKTTILTERWVTSFLYLLVWEKKSVSEALGSITALTFTRKAASEMKIRIRSRIDELWSSEELVLTLENIKTYAGDYPDSKDKILDNLINYKETIDDLLSGAMITTINSFVLQQLRAHPLELDFDIGSTPEDTGTDISSTEKESQILVLRKLIQNQFPMFEEQIFQLGMNLCGSKKWITLLEQIRKLSAQYGDQAIAQAFDQSTFLVFQDRVFSAARAEDPLKAIWELINPSKQALLETLEKELYYNGKLTTENNKLYQFLKNSDYHILPSMFSKDILGSYKFSSVKKDEELNELRKNSLEAYQNFIDTLYRIILPLMLPISDLCAKQVQIIQSEHKEISFNQSEIIFLDSLDKPDFLQKVQSRIRFFFADEYQDTSDIQKSIFDLILSDPKIVPFFVGDPKQSIYSFRQANVYVFEQTVQEFLDKKYHYKHLNINYRSAPSHVDLINYLFKEIFENDSSGIKYHDQLAKQNIEGFFQYTTVLGSEDQEKYLTAERLDSAFLDTLGAIQSLLADGVKPGEILVLFRNKASILTFYRLAKESAPQLPLSSSVRHILWDNSFITPLLSFLRVLVYPHDDLNVVELLKTFLFRKTDTEINNLLIEASTTKKSLFNTLNSEDQLLLNELTVLRDRIPLEELISLILQSTDYEDILYMLPESTDAVATLRLFLDEAQKLQQKRDMSVSEFISYIDQKKTSVEEAEFSGEEGSTLRLMTIHSSKGLESPHVIYVHKAGSQERRIRFPLYLHGKVAFDIFGKGVMAEQLGELDIKEYIAEEKRLAYVALTRAKNSFTFCSLPSIIKSSGTEVKFFETQWASFLNKELIEAHPIFSENKRSFTPEEITSPPKEEQSQNFQEYHDRYLLLKQKDTSLDRQALPQFLSVSLLLDAEFNPNQFHQKYRMHSFDLIDSLRQLGEEEPVFGALNSNDIGTLVHSLLQNFDHPSKEDALKFLQNHHYDQAEIFELALSYAYGYWESEFYQNMIKDCIQSDKERQVLNLIQNNIMIRAAADLYVSSSDQKHTIVDYKLSVSKKNIKRYERQLAYYALLSEKSGCKVDSLVLFDLKKTEVYNIDWNIQETEQLFQNAVNRTLEFLTEKDLRIEKDTLFD